MESVEAIAKYWWRDQESGKIYGRSNSLEFAKQAAEDIAKGLVFEEGRPCEIVEMPEGRILDTIEA